MKLFAKIAFTILFFILLYLASINSLFFVISLLICPIAIIILIAIKLKNINKIKHKKFNYIEKVDN